MRIDWSPQLRSASAARRDVSGGASSDHSFADAVAGEPPTAHATSVGTASSVDNLFLLQEVSDELTGGRRRAAARGGALLDRLDDLRLALLAGAVPRARLTELAQLARQGGEATDDPKLAGILGEIELRVAVELAKLAQPA